MKSEFWSTVGLIITLEIHVIWMLSVHSELANSAISLYRIKPKSGLSLCPGDLVEYICTIDGVALVWQENSKLYWFNGPGQINTTKVGKAFSFKLDGIVNGITYVSTARMLNSSSFINDVLLTCTDGVALMSENVTVRAQPDSCQGRVSCAVNPNSNKKLTDITITLNDVTAGHQCVVGYKFEFASQSKYVPANTSLSATFTFDKEQKLTYENLGIFTYDSKNQPGAESCPIIIRKPNQVEIYPQLTYDEITHSIFLHLKWMRPSLPSETCLDANQLQWEYKISFLNMTFTTQSTNFTYHLDDVSILSPSAEYSVSIIPVLSDLGLSGDSTTKTLKTSCILSTNSDGAEQALGDVLIIITLAVVTFML